MLQRSHTIFTLRRGPTSLEFSSPRFCVVRQGHPHLHVRLTDINLFARFILGIVVMLFFQCMVGMFNPANNRRGGH